jgi:predicted ATP-binding protein involved in virulence
VINRIIIKNYKTIQNLDLRLNDTMNILVGNNEQGKSTDVKRGSREKPSHILIEIYIQENEQASHLKGTINSVRENACGVKLEIEFNEECEMRIIGTVLAILNQEYLNFRIKRTVPAIPCTWFCEPNKSIVQ